MILVYSGLSLDRFMHDSGYSGFGLDRFIQDSGLFRVQFRQDYTGF